MRQYYHHKEPVTLECGAILPEITVAYNTFGRMNESRDNIVWVMHALTADSDVADWWPHTVEKGRFLDPGDHFIVCANVIGSCYGSTGPISENPLSGEPYFGDFPDVTVRDMVACHRLLARHLGINRIDTVIGSIRASHARPYLLPPTTVAIPGWRQSTSRWSWRSKPT